MRIANIVLSSQNGGVEQIMIDYCQILKNLGHEVIAIIRHDAPYALKLEQIGITIEKIHHKYGYIDIFAINKIKNILNSKQIEILFSHSSKATTLAHKAIKKIKNKKIPQIAINHSNNVKRSLVANLILSVNKTIFYKTIDLGRNETNSFVMPNAIDTADLDDFLPSLNFSQKKIITIGAIARFDKNKGFDYLIKALKNLSTTTSIEFQLKIAGSGDMEFNLKELAKNLQLSDKIEFCGWIENKEDFFKKIDIFCLPSLNETFGIVLLEAMKYKTPIIATNCDGPQEIIRHETDGLLVTLHPLDSLDQRISTTIVKLVSSDNLANSLIYNSLSRLKKHYSFEIMSKKMQDLLNILNS
jgi:glycosyltransferase involved in cell wall biosynthesis